jgi:hypothetical protein
MRNRRTWVDVVGPILGLAAVGMVVFSLVYLLSIRPFYRGGSYDIGRSVAGGPGWVRGEGTETFSQAFDTLLVRNVSGPVHVEGWSEDSIQVSWVKEARSESALEEFEIRLQPSGRTLEVQPIYGPMPGTQFGSVSFEIRIPASLSTLRVKNVSGRIQLENLPADLDQDLETVSGRIETERAAGLRAKSVSGSIDFVSTGGRIGVNTTSGQVRGEILALTQGDSVQVESISGSVELEAFSGLDATVTLQSVSGSISCDFPVQVSEQRRNRLEGTIGGGSVPLEVKTVSGRIRLQRTD